MDIVCVGLLLCDILVKPVTPECFHVDATPIDPLIMSTGGDACNVAINVANLGLKSSVISAVGGDENGAFLLSRLRENGVETAGIKTSKDYASAVSVVLVRPDGERNFLINTDVYSEITPAMITKDLLRGAKILSFNSVNRIKNLDYGGIVPAFQMAREMGITTACDTVWNRSDDWLARISDILYHTDIFLPSYNEAIEITGQTEVPRMRDFFSKFGIGTLVIKMGEQGSYVTDFNDEFYVKPFPVEKIVSTGGAGDTYVAGFLSAQVMGLDIYESALFASAAASYTVAALASTGALPKAEAVRQLVKEKRHLVE
jgi:ribokinase